MIVREYVRADGTSPFGTWFEGLDPQAAAKVATVLLRLEAGNLSNLKSIGGGLAESRIGWGPGYRLYLHRDGDELIVLFTGGTKKRQQADIDRARELLAEYKARKAKAGRPKRKR